MPALAGKHVLVTRPAARTGEMCARLAAAGAQVYRAPLQDIVATGDTPALHAACQDLDRHDAVIVTSRNAVDLGLPALAARWPQWPVAQAWLAVGAATARALADFGIHAQVPADARSEGLLALPALADIAGKRILLLTGEGGRGLLEAELAARGARVTRLAVYRREAGGTAAPAIAAFAAAPPLAGTRYALVTSGEALQNLLALAPWLAGSDVVVVVASARTAASARSAGLADVIDAGGADDDHQFAALLARAGSQFVPEDDA